MSRTLKSIIIVILIFQNCCCYYYCFSFLLPFFLVITSSTCMLTSTTCKPVIYLTCSFTNSVTLRKIFGADSPYSKITFKSIAACFSPTSTETPVVTLFPLENALVKLSAKPPSYLRYL